MPKNKLEIKKYSRFFILILFIITLTILRPNSFLTINNFSNVLWSISVVGILTSGSIFVMLLGGIDLSVGSIMGLSSVLLVSTIRSFDYSNYGVLIGIGLTLGIGILIGLVHGLIITQFKVPAFLVTFASQSILLGLAMLLSHNKILSALEPDLFTNIGLGKLGPFTFPIYFMIIIVLISHYLLDRTVFGRHLYAIGGNALASRISGVRNDLITIMAYVISSITATLGGIVLASMTQQGMASTGRGYETEVITAAVIGGVSLMGGSGRISGAIIGAMLVGFLNNGLNLMNVPSTSQGFVKGIVIITAVAIDIKAKNGFKKFNLPKWKRRKRI